MSASLRISADTSDVKKSLLDLSKEVKNLGKSKISVFSDSDKRFIKGELKQELSLMKSKLAENRSEISKMIKEQSKLEKGSKAELEHRKKILEAYRTQTRLAQQMTRLQGQRSDVSGGAGSGGITGFLGKLGGLLGGAALATGGLALMRGYQASSQYTQGARNRVQLRGLTGEGAGSMDPAALANAGLNEQDFIQRRIAATSRLGRAGGSSESILQQARFERAYGLEDGTMTNIAGSLRSSFGGRGADAAQAKLQASIFASGIEDAIGPYLEVATDLLSEINKNGMTNSDEMIRLMAELTKDGKRTPEQIAAAFTGMDSAVRGASGEANAFLQTAFSRGGIGGGTIGATRLAMSSGGIMGLSEDELLSRGYNSQLVKNMKGAGFTSGVGNRSGAILDQFKRSAGISGSIGDVTDLNTMVGLSSMANSVLGTNGIQGFDALKMMEQVQNKQMSQKQFDEKLQEMRAGKDPSIERLSKINSSLEGQTEILRNIRDTLMEALGKSAVKVANVAAEANNALIQGTGSVGDTLINQTGMGDAALRGAKSARSNLFGGGIGNKLYNLFKGSPEEENARIMREAESRVRKNGNLPSSSGGISTAPQVNDLTEAVEKGMTRAMRAQKSAVIQNNNRVNVKVVSPNGQVSNKTHK